jgi:chorismate mutase
MCLGVGARSGPTQRSEHPVNQLASPPAPMVRSTGSDLPAPWVAITAGRERIDDLDRRIIALVKERIQVSREIQQARISTGGRRVELSREMDILERYRESLGKPGTTVALALLELCRGRT